MKLRFRTLPLRYKNDGLYMLGIHHIHYTQLGSNVRERKLSQWRCAAEGSHNLITGLAVMSLISGHQRKDKDGLLR